MADKDLQVWRELDQREREGPNIPGRNEWRRCANDLAASLHTVLDGLPPSLRASMDLYREDPEAWQAESKRKHENGVRLIEQRDELLAALKQIIDGVDEFWMTENPGAVDAAQAAIERAEGRISPR